MSTRSIETDAGPLTVRDPAPETLEQFEALFPTVTPIEVEGRQLLGLVLIDGPLVLRGLRTGYGYIPPQPPEAFATMLAIERLRIVEATAAFRSRRFQGVLMPAACQTGSPDGHSQVGELMFLRARGPLARGLGKIDPIPGYEEEFGSGATDVIFSFIKEICGAWKAAGSGDIKVSDIEPCSAKWDGMRWRADIALVDDRILVIRPELVPEDPLLSALVRVGVTNIEHTPSVFLLPPPESSVARGDR